MDKAMKSEIHEMRIFSGSAHPLLAGEICKYLNVKLGDQKISQFKDGEVYTQIKENVRGRDIFIIQPASKPVNENLMELLVTTDAFKRASAYRITAVIPYYAYARQDRKDKPRVPITAKLIADLLSAAGVDRVLTVDLHAPQIQGFFNVPVDNLIAAPIIIEYIKKQKSKDLTIVSPDAGGVERARIIANVINAKIALLDKRRDKPNEAEIMHIIGDVKGRDCFIVDDMIDTAGTLIKAAKAIKENGATSIRAAATHPVFSANAVERINNSELLEVIVTNSIPLTEDAEKSEKIKQLSVGPLLGEAIKRIHTNSSVSSLFEWR
jgi:ribose-phosphate pyrophosphokinase